MNATISLHSDWFTGDRVYVWGKGRGIVLYLRYAGLAGVLKLYIIQLDEGARMVVPGAYLLRAGK